MQLLVSNNDVENYRQVDRDLFILKILTEKSELWVHADKLRSDEINELNGRVYDESRKSSTTDDTYQ